MTEPVQDNLADKPDSFDDLCQMLRQQHYCYLPADQVQQWLLHSDIHALSDWHEFARSWHDLVLDPYMADGGRYRRRRHSTFSALPSTGEWQRAPHQPHYQSLSYNPLNGGILRYYQPISNAVQQSRAFNALLNFACSLFSRMAAAASWHIEAHQFRIEADQNQQGLPTPEGIHRDGVDYVMMVLVDRQRVEAGVSQIFDNNQQLLDEFTLYQPVSVAIVNDREVFHRVTAIRSTDHALDGYRDVLVLTFKDRCEKE